MTIRYLSAQVVANRLCAARQTGWMRLAVPALGEVVPGQFVQLTCGDDLTLPRPFSVLACDAAAGTIELFYRVVGEGTRRMAAWQPGEEHALLGPLGRPFSQPPAGSRVLLVAGGVGLAPLDFLARSLAARGQETVLFMGTEGELPFPLQPESAVDALPAGIALQSLQRLGVANRLASLRERPGFFRGLVTDLAIGYVQQLSLEERARLWLVTCGPMAMMAALARWAATEGVPGEASLEAHMACGYGVCVGCVTGIHQAEGHRLYRRVCVDGPVFALQAVDWQQAG
ncbi:MAG: dihydroorotate dehydrogenase electron transfer subunit [Magnetococcales bacterium]|nr:dihydroorotate dehydrogenase electron transfer subunit [Magnetococcales bacterium]